MNAIVTEEVGKPMKDWPEPKCPAGGEIVRVDAS